MNTVQSVQASGQLSFDDIPEPASPPRLTIRDLYVGAKFGKLTVLDMGKTESVGQNNRKCRFVPTRCDCGNEKTVRWDDLRSGQAASCGCRIAEVTAERNFKHGESHTPLFMAWQSMHMRCENPKDVGYKNYGGRGITVCTEWSEYKPFSDWAKANGYTHGLQIDRIDNDGGYSPENCRFVTSTQNQRNKRTNRLLTAFGETKCIMEWTEDPRCVVCYSSLVERIDAGFAPEIALTMEYRHGYRTYPR